MVWRQVRRNEFKFTVSIPFRLVALVPIILRIYWPPVANATNGVRAISVMSSPTSTGLGECKWETVNDFLAVSQL